MIPSRLKPFIPYLAAYRKEVTIGILSLLATDSLAMVIPWLLKSVIDLLPQKPDPAELLQYAGLIFVTAVGLGLSRFGWRQYLFGPSRRIEVDIQNRLFEHFLTLDRTYYQNQKVGDLMSRATNDLRAVKDFLGLGLLIFVDAVAVIVASVSLMLYISPRMTLVCLLPLPVISILFFSFIRKISERHQAIQENLSRITSRVQENLAGIRVLHAFAQEENEKRKFDDLNRDHIRRNLDLAKLFGFFTPSLVFMIGLAAVISLWVGGKAVIQGEISLGSFVAFNGYLMLLSWPMMAIGYIINLTQKGLTAMQRLSEIFEARPSQPVPQEEPSPPELKGRIEFRNVKFRYPGSEKFSLLDVNFNVEPGQRVAVIGPVGSGKTTLLQLVLSQYDVEEGQLLLDGRPVNKIPARYLRERIVLVEQEPFLFSVSVRDNIRLGVPETSDEIVEDMVRCVCLQEDVARWPEGLDTIVGERGVSLSGGQKQRIALARALIRQPRILILDDAFSNLDVETEHAIFHNIQRYLQGVTTVMVTHRLATGREADQIVVLEEGRVIESGSHAELMRQDGYYHRVYRQQALAQQMEITLQ